MPHLKVVVQKPEAYYLIKMSTLLTYIRTYWIAITLCILAAITILSLWPLQKLPAVPGSDKLHHLVAYAALMTPTALRKPKYWLLIGIFFIVWSGMIELIQPYVNRHGEWQDMLANSSGVICGLVVVELLSRLLHVKSEAG